MRLALAMLLLLSCDRDENAPSSTSKTSEKVGAAIACPPGSKRAGKPRVSEWCELDGGVKHGQFRQYENGALKFEATYERGVLAGTARTLYPNGKVKTEGAMAAGQQTGSWRFYFESGKLQSEGAFKAGRRFGPWAYWHENGQMEREVTFGDNELPEGTLVEWYPSGIKKRTATYVRGELQGPVAQWHPSGQKEVEYNNDHGKPNGPVTYWDATGRKTAQGTFSAGEKAGEWSEFDERGDVKASVTYDKGREVSRRIQSSGPAGSSVQL